MAENVFRFIVRTQGVCCPVEYVRLTRKEDANELADFLGVHVRTIRQWRRKRQKKLISCERSNNCPHRLNAEPIVLPRQRRIRPAVPSASNDLSSHPSHDASAPCGTEQTPCSSPPESSSTPEKGQSD